MIRCNFYLTKLLKSLTKRVNAEKSFYRKKIETFAGGKKRNQEKST